jgi:hypothetical protein
MAQHYPGKRAEETEASLTQRMLTVGQFAPLHRRFCFENQQQLLQSVQLGDSLDRLTLCAQSSPRVRA